ncbi:DNA cross-link repair protein SNM1 [Rhynchospora pubera]|uniref:DNA cross-link repair protein SNM1 n=1 Tax=Rhynchospora pubera TaxID=906938 RepID=A0AAV8D7F3_9POAL|nr:DNA cross-link repair protein SNM1 [Rhynchospora pubera]
MDLEIRAEDPLSFSDSEELDENGFPLASSSGSDKAESTSEPTSCNDDRPHKKLSEFASDFYASGSDCTSLLRIRNEKKNGLLVQKNLLQMWGIAKSEVAETSESRVCTENRKRKWKGKEQGDVFGLKLNQKKNEKGKKPAHVQSRSCPFYKKIPGTPFTVDAFRYGAIEGCSAYFLTHFHYDHYGGLTKRWCHGPIYCTSITARLLDICLSVSQSYICALEYDKEYEIEGIKVTFIEANHCPGAALVHLRLSDGRTYLHTGDFRASKSMQSHPILLNYHVNVLYLDTTYCNPKYRFPSKEEVIAFVVRTTQKYLQKQPKTLVVVGAYSIGKERVYLEISRSLQVPIYTNASRRRILESFGWSDLSSSLSNSSHSTRLHVLPLSFLRLENLNKYLATLNQRFNAVLAFRPTGWTFSEATGSKLDLIKPTSKGNITIYGVPYSEHSSFNELRDFVKFLRPDKIIPTVNASSIASRDNMQALFNNWLKS